MKGIAWKTLGGAIIAGLWTAFAYYEDAPDWALVAIFGIIYTNMYAHFTRRDERE